jgi:hypothetical protein
MITIPFPFPNTFDIPNSILHSIPKFYQILHFQFQTIVGVVWNSISKLQIKGTRERVSGLEMEMGKRKMHGAGLAW